MRPHHGTHLSALMLLFCFTTQLQAQSNFYPCKIKVMGIQNGTIKNDSSFDPLYYKEPYLLGSGKKRPEPMLTRKGCTAICGSSPHFNKPEDAFGILTTWVLPMLALFSNLPFESVSKRKIRLTLEALVNWIGSPQSAFTTTMFNIYQIRNCKQKTDHKGHLRQQYIDSFFVLSCINQYYYARYATKGMNPDEAKNLENRRNRALFYGLFRPLSTHSAAKEKMPGDVEETRFLLSNLASQLRALRRRGVYPMMLNIIWFCVAFIISLVLAFARLGDSTTAHSLALGLGLSWLPALVFMTVVDRNPVSPTRCKVLIERWLYNVDAIIEFNKDLSLASNPTPSIGWWTPQAEPLELVIDDFVGQGRRLRHCGVTNTVLDRLEHASAAISLESYPWRYEDELDIYEQLVTDFEEDIKKRPTSWWVCWFCGGISVSIGVGMAIFVGFMTGTIGLGCRSLLWLMFWLLSSVSWYFQAFFQEPPRFVRRISVGINSLAFLLLLTIMILQTIGGLNNCLCKSSSFAKGFGGYMDFEDAASHKEAFPYIVTSWAIAAAIGPLGGVLPVLWALRRWARSSELWKFDEQPMHLVGPLQRPKEGDLRQWREGSDPVYWLT